MKFATAPDSCWRCKVTSRISPHGRNIWQIIQIIHDNAHLLSIQIWISLLSKVIECDCLVHSAHQADGEADGVRANHKTEAIRSTPLECIRTKANIFGMSLADPTRHRVRWWPGGLLTLDGFTAWACHAAASRSPPESLNTMPGRRIGALHMDNEKRWCTPDIIWCKTFILQAWFIGVVQYIRQYNDTY